MSYKFNPFTGTLDLQLANSVSGIDHGGLAGLADDDHTQYLLIDGTRAMTGNLDLGGNHLESSGAINIYASGDSTDYLQFITTSSRPAIKRISGNTIYFEADSASFVTVQIQEDTSNYLQLYWDKSSNLSVIKSTGDLRIQANNDTDDYLSIVTTTNQTTLNWVGQDGKITADNGTIDFDNENLTTTGTVTVGTLTDGTASLTGGALTSLTTLNASTGLLKTTAGTISFITDNSTNWDTAYTHSQDNTQAHSDYLLNNANDTTSGRITMAGADFGGNYVDWTEIAAPANPGANVARMYSKDDGGTTKMYFRDSVGTETELGGGAGAPGGANTQLQYNDGGSFGGIADFTWDDTDLLVGGVTGTTKLQFRDANIYISSQNDGYMDFTIDTAFRFRNTSLTTDISLLFGTGASNEGELKWMEDEDYFLFPDEILIDTDKQLFFRDANIYINSNADGEMQLSADGQLNITTGTVQIVATTGLDLDSANLNTVWTVNTTNKIQFRDAGLFINSSVDGQLDIDADAELEITAPIVDIDASTGLALDGANLNSTWTVNTNNQLQFRDSALYINSDADGHLDFHADTSFDFNAATNTDLVINLTATTNSGVITYMEDEDRLDFDMDVQFDQSATFDLEFDNGNSGAADTIDWGVGNKQKSTLTDNVTYTFTAPDGVCNLIFRLIQDGTGGRDATFPATVKWLGTEPTWTDGGAGKTIIAAFYYDGTNYWAQGTEWET